MNKQTFSSALLFMQDIGKLISNELIRQERTPAWLANKLGCDRTNAYKILKRSSIDTALLARICMILKHDFFLDLSASTPHCDNMATNC
ncbi:MAG: XRE family transcriptional regulator [Bacteroidaceae bacterium]